MWGGGKNYHIELSGVSKKIFVVYYGRVNINYTCISLEIPSLRLTIEQRRHDTEAL